MRANCVSIVYRIKDFQLFRYRLEILRINYLELEKFEYTEKRQSVS